MTVSGVDTSWAQKAFWPAGFAFNIVCASRGNRSSVGLEVDDYYQQRVDNNHAAGVETGHYFFNGNIDPVQCADFFVDNLYGYQQGLDVLVIDSESEESTGTVAWEPNQVLAWAQRVVERTGCSPRATAVYLNQSLLDQYGDGWAICRDFGIRLWIAAPDGIYTTGPWSTWDLWQYAITDLDYDYAQTTLAEMAGGTDVGDDAAILEEDMPSGYYVKGDVDASLFWLDQATGLARPSSIGEYTAANVFNQATGGKFGTGALCEVPQDQMDSIPKIKPRTGQFAQLLRLLVLGAIAVVLLVFTAFAHTLWPHVDYPLVAILAILATLSGGAAVWPTRE